jgi:hypothetical protein
VPRWPNKRKNEPFNPHLRTDLAQQLVPYACADVTFNSTTEVLNKTFPYEELEGKYGNYDIQLLPERPASQIKLATPRECQAAQHFVNEGHVVPFLSVNDKSKEGLIVHALASKLYEMAWVSLNWDALDFQDSHGLGHPLFQVYKYDQENNIPAEAQLPLCKEVVGSSDEEGEEEGAAAVNKETEEETTTTT